MGEKFISLLACSILTAYKGVLGNIRGLAVTTVTATNAKTMPNTAIDIFLFLFMVFTSVGFELLTQEWL
jgi:hypothetical protein